MTHEPRRHVIITGTGRAGTTFLVELLTRLGLDTGYSPEKMKLSENARAGLEKDVRREDAPHVVKSPWFCDYAREVLRREDIRIEHIFVPMRDLHAAAESRRFVVAKTPVDPAIRPSEIPGGLWHTDQGKEQEGVLLLQLYKLLLAVSETNVPLTLMRFPRLAKEPDYLFDKLRPILGEVDPGRFRAVFDETVRPEWMHSFNENDV